AQHVLDIVEAVGRQLLDRVDHAFRAAAPVRAHDLRRHRQSLLLIGYQRLTGRLERASASARQRESRMACDAPFDPTGYIGWAASPSSVTRPLDQYGSGSRSQVGYS